MNNENLESSPKEDLIALRNKIQSLIDEKENEDGFNIFKSALIHVTVLSHREKILEYCITLDVKENVEIYNNFTIGDFVFESHRYCKFYTTLVSKWRLKNFINLLKKAGVKVEYKFNLTEEKEMEWITEHTDYLYSIREEKEFLNSIGLEIK